MEINKPWYPKTLTATLFSVMLGVLTTITINLLTDSFSTNPCLSIIKIVSIVLFILSSIASWNLLNIRIEIDEELLKRTYDNKAYGLDSNKIWEATLEEKIGLKRKFKFWKWGGIVSIVIGVILVFIVNVKNREYNINYENRMHENSTIIADSIGQLNKRLGQQNVLLIQLKDSLQSIKKEMQISNDIWDGQEKH